MLKQVNRKSSWKFHSPVICLYPPGVVDYLTTEISTSKQKKFSLVTFVDTPGLVDGDMKYPFDVNKAILWLGMEVIFIYCCKHWRRCAWDMTRGYLGYRGQPGENVPWKKCREIMFGTKGRKKVQHDQLNVHIVYYNVHLCCNN